MDELNRKAQQVFERVMEGFHIPPRSQLPDAQVGELMKSVAMKLQQSFAEAELPNRLWMEMLAEHLKPKGYAVSLGPSVVLSPAEVIMLNQILQECPEVADLSPEEQQEFMNRVILELLANRRRKALDPDHRRN